MEPPLIGITAGNDPRSPGMYAVRWDYIRSIERAGGVPLVLAPSGAALHSKLVDRLDGLVLTGGLDIDPAAYNEAPHPSVIRTSPERDEFEFLLVRGALHRELPILGICRGQQILNVALGGNLVQDIPTMVGPEVLHNHPHKLRHEIFHEVLLKPGTRLHEILGSDRVAVNSIHHQAVKNPGEGVVPIGWADDGVIEAIEVPALPFVMGVQWHPEAFWDHGAAFAPLFSAFIDEARQWHLQSA